MTQLTHTSFKDDIKGSLKPGKLADFIILDLNLFDFPPETIREGKILATYVGVKKIFAQNK
ncbi:MAG: amidohydrolase family protein [Bacteroidetes bacterium]|nr:amidohydrolase family protein [Bacteroidota bacterium]